MKHYRNPTTGEVFAYDSEDERQQWGAPELVPMTDEEVAQFRSPQVPLSKRIESALQQIDRDTDRIYTETVGARVEEYRQAEADALAFKEAGYAGDVPPFVADHLAAKEGWTAQQAADDILATAAAWRGAQAQIRANRLQCKELARKAADPAGVEAALQQWAGFVAAIRTALGLSI